MRSRESSMNDYNANPDNTKFDTFEIAPMMRNYGDPVTRKPNVTRLSTQTLNISSHDKIDGDPDDNDETNSSSNQSIKKFGTFDGVLGRCLLCMFGVILFLRMGWIVAHAGIYESTLIVLLSASITFFTTLSLSAITTNGDISHGGPYFLISRSLGPEIGGVVGILFAFGNCVGIALHLVGFSVAVVDLYSNYISGSEHWDTIFVSELSLLFLIIIAYHGVGWIIKFNLGLLFLMSVSIIVFIIGTFTTKPDTQNLGFTGYSSNTFNDNLHSKYMDNYDFVLITAIFFPSVTGCMAGANISGDLKNPSRSIPLGTMSAVFISTIVYIIIIWILGSTCLRSSDNGKGGLYNDYLIMSSISAFRPLVDMGIFASTFSSATSCFVAAPRILKTICDDGLLPFLNWFGKGRESDEEPIRAYIIVSIIAFITMLTGNINFIAPIVTIFFMLCYAFINYSVWAWSQSKSPGWRPQFKFYHPYISLFATIQCIILMVLIDWIITIITLFIGAILYKYIKSLKINKYWGSTIEAINLKTTCKMALKSQKSKPNHAKILKPLFLILNTSKDDTLQLFDLAAQLNFAQGLIIIGHVIIGDLNDPLIMNKYIKLQKSCNIQNLPKEIFNQCILETCIAKDFVTGSKYLFQLCGIGGIRPNCVLIKMSDIDHQNGIEDIPPIWLENVHTALSIECGVVLVPNHVRLIDNIDIIDIYWLYDDGGLTVLIGYLLTLSPKWKQHKIRIMALDCLGFDDCNKLVSLMNKLRINCEIVSVTNVNDDDLNINQDDINLSLPISEFAAQKIRKYKSIGKCIDAHSSSSSLCIITLPFPRQDYKWWEYQQIIQSLTPNSCPSIFVRGNQEQMLCYTL